jgi:hypothetical protein
MEQADTLHFPMGHEDKAEALCKADISLLASQRPKGKCGKVQGVHELGWEKATSSFSLTFR